MRSVRPAPASPRRISGLSRSRGERIRFAAAAALAAFASVAWPILAAVVSRHWYAGLLKPFFAPAPWLAGLMLLAVAAAAGRALFRLLCRPDYHPDRLRAVRTLCVALALSEVWVWAFFVGRHPTLSLALAAALIVASGLAVARAAAVEGRAAVLLLPWTAACVLVGLVDLSVRLRNG